MPVLRGYGVVFGPGSTHPGVESTILSSAAGVGHIHPSAVVCRRDESASIHPLSSAVGMKHLHPTAGARGIDTGMLSAARAVARWTIDSP